MAFLAAIQAHTTNANNNKYYFLTHRVLHDGASSYRHAGDLRHLTLPPDMMCMGSNVLDYNCLLKEDEIGKNEYYAESERGYSDMLCMLENKKFRVDFPEEGALLMLCLAKKNKLKEFENEIYYKIKPLFGSIRFFPRESESVLVMNEIPLIDLAVSMCAFGRSVNKIANGEGELGVEIRWNRTLAPLYMELCEMFCNVICSGVAEEKVKAMEFLKRVENTMKKEGDLSKKLKPKRNSGIKMMHMTMLNYYNGDGDRSLMNKVETVGPILAKMLRKYDPEIGNTKEDEKNKFCEIGKTKKQRHRENSVKQSHETWKMYCSRFLSRVRIMNMNLETKQGMKRELFDAMMSVLDEIKIKVPDWRRKQEGIDHDVFMGILDDTDLSEELRAFCFHEFEDSFLRDPKNIKSPSLEALVSPVSMMVQNARRKRRLGTDDDISLVNSLIERAFQMNCRSLCLSKDAKQLHYKDFPYYCKVAVCSDVPSNVLLSSSVNTSFLQDVIYMTINVQGEAFMPNALVECINSFFFETGYSWNGWKTIASDIFEGSFSQNYATAASKAANVLYQTLYSEHFKLDEDYKEMLKNSKLSSEVFNEMVKKRVFEDDAKKLRFSSMCYGWSVIGGAYVEECANYLGGSSFLALFIALEEIESTKIEKSSILCYGAEHCVKYIIKTELCCPMVKYANSYKYTKARRQAISNALLYVSLAFETKDKSLAHLKHMHQAEFERCGGEGVLKMPCCEHFESVFGRRTIEYKFDGRNMFN